MEALGLQLWLEEVVQSEALRPRVVPQVLDMVAADRAGTVVSEQLIRQVIQMLTDLGPGAYEKVRQAPPLRTLRTLEPRPRRQRLPRHPRRRRRRSRQQRSNGASPL